jgi:hypothetical protein
MEKINISKKSIKFHKKWFPFVERLVWLAFNKLKPDFLIFLASSMLVYKIE